MFTHTKDKLKYLKKKALEDLVRFAGGRAHLGKMLGLPTPTINSWLSRGMISKVGADIVASHPTFEKYFPVSRMRPDL